MVRVRGPLISEPPRIPHLDRARCAKLARRISIGRRNGLDLDRHAPEREPPSERLRSFLDRYDDPSKPRPSVMIFERESEPRSRRGPRVGRRKSRNAVAQRPEDASDLAVLADGCPGKVGCIAERATLGFLDSAFPPGDRARADVIREKLEDAAERS